MIYFFITKKISWNTRVIQFFGEFFCINILFSFSSMASMEVEQSLSQRQGFSSEQFKIEIQNLPKFFGIGQMKKLLVKRLKVKPHKIKPCGPKATYMFMNFANEVDREDAITKLDGYELKGKKLKAFKIRAAKDPMIKGMISRFF